VNASTMVKNVEVFELRAVIAKDIKELFEICKDSYITYVVPVDIKAYELNAKGW
jgi:hypothetical protein